MSMGPNKAWELMYREWRNGVKECFLPELEDRQRLVRACRGKIAFPNFLMAMLTADKMTRNGDVKPGQYLNVYHCQLCGFEHIGNRKSAD